MPSVFPTANDLRDLEKDFPTNLDKYLLDQAIQVKANPTVSKRELVWGELLSERVQEALRNRGYTVSGDRDGTTISWEK